jgi:molecular chaperone GrpE
MNNNEENLKHSDEEELEEEVVVNEGKAKDTQDKKPEVENDKPKTQEEPSDGEKKEGKQDKEKPHGEGKQKDKHKEKNVELEKAQAAAEDYKRKWYSVSAEYDNYRKRNQAAVSQAYADGKAEAILKLLPVSDTFGYAYDGASDEKTKAGIDKIIKNFNNILRSLGVEEVQINVGDAFDEGLAEAIMNVPCEEGEQPNCVKQVLKKGYKQGEKVIRFAQVVVTI